VAGDGDYHDVASTVWAGSARPYGVRPRRYLSSVHDSSDPRSWLWGWCSTFSTTRFARRSTVNDKVLKEARKRRDLVAEAAMEIEGALRWFRSGSVAHGWVNRPVTDADSGLVLDRRVHTTLGPDGEGEGPEDIVDELRDLVERKVREEYPNAKVTKSRRGLLVEFNEPVTDEEDPTVDLIVTLTRKDADSLWIPDLDKDEWTPSHPEKHTELFTGGARELRALRARVVRLAKAWNKQWFRAQLPQWRATAAPVRRAYCACVLRRYRPKRGPLRRRPRPEGSIKGSIPSSRSPTCKSIRQEKPRFLDFCRAL
jgi:hypothetical protein